MSWATVTILCLASCVVAGLLTMVAPRQDQRRWCWLSCLSFCLAAWSGVFVLVT